MVPDCWFPDVFSRYCKNENMSSFVIDSIEAYANSNYKTVFKKIEPGEIRRGNILFKEMPKHDGVSIIKIYFNNKEKSFGLGYYTNGASLDYGFKIKIENDSIYIDNY